MMFLSKLFGEMFATGLVVVSTNLHAVSARSSLGFLLAVSRTVVACTHLKREFVL